MAIVSKGNPRTRQSGATPTSLKNAQSIMPEVDGKTIWYGRSVGLYSFPNDTDDTAYMKVQVANLDQSEYEITIKQGVLDSADGITYPVHLAPDFTERVARDLQYQPFANSQKLSGAMFAIPAQSRAHIALRVTHDRADKQECSIVFYEHPSIDRDSPAFSETPTVARALEWIPAPSTEGVICEVFSPPSKFLFWELDSEADRVYFRPWNVGPKSGRFPWSLPMFHHPECIVRVGNGSAFPVRVVPHLVLSREDAEGNSLQKAQEELLTNATLQPGEEREWPCSLSLSDVRMPRQEAEQMRIRSLVEVFGPSATPLNQVKAPQTIKTDYQKWPSKLIDLVVLAVSTVFCLFFLLWIVKGLPYPVTPELDVKLQFGTVPVGELPPGVQSKDLDVELTRTGEPNVKGVDKQNGTEHLFQFKFDRVLAWRRWPFEWTEVAPIFNVTITDDTKNYEFKAQDNNKLIIFPAPTVTQTIKDIDVHASVIRTHKQNAEEALKQADVALKSAAQQIGSNLLAKVNLGLASEQLAAATTEVAAVPPGPDKQQLQTTLANAQTQSVTLQGKEITLEQKLSNTSNGHAVAEQQVQSAFKDAETAIQNGLASLPKDKPAAQRNAHNADANLKAAEDLLVGLKDVPEAASLQTSLLGKKNELTQLQEEIRKTPDAHDSTTTNVVTPVHDPKTTISHDPKTTHHEGTPVVPAKDPAWKLAYNDLLDRHYAEAVSAAKQSPNDPKALAISAIASAFLNDMASATASLSAANQQEFPPEGVTSPPKTDDSTDAALVLTAQGFVDATPLPDARIQIYDKAIAGEPHLSLPYILKLRLLIQNAHGQDSSAKIRDTVHIASSQSPSFLTDVRRPLMSNMQSEAYETNHRLLHRVAYEALNSALGR